MVIRCAATAPRGPYHPIIMLTAKTQEAEKVLGLQLGADDYVTKPFSPLSCARASRPCWPERSRRARNLSLRRPGSGLCPGRAADAQGSHRFDALEFKMLAAFIRNRGGS